MTHLERLEDIALHKARLAAECLASDVPRVRRLGEVVLAEAMAVSWALDQLAPRTPHTAGPIPTG